MRSSLPKNQSLLLALLGCRLAACHPFHLLKARADDGLGSHHLHRIHARDESYLNAVDYTNLPVDWNAQNYNPTDASGSPNPVTSALPSTSSAAASTDDGASSGSDNATSTGSGYSGTKRGLVYNAASPPLSVFAGVGSLLNSWCYNWNSAPDQDLPNGIQYVPLLHSLEPVHTDSWKQDADKAIANSGDGNTWLLGFNEPDMPDQANLAPGDAVNAWQQYMQPYAGKDNVKLGSPAVSNSPADNQGLSWLEQFLQQCSSCQIDFVPVHWYGCTDGCALDEDVDNFKQHIEKCVQTAGKKPVWLTEFASHGDQEGFIKEVLPWLDAKDGVQRYSYFMVSDGSLTQGNGISGLGQTYANA